MIKILERRGVEQFDVVGRWDDGEWVDGGDRLDFPNSEYYDEDMMVERFDGPILFARPSEGSEEKTVGDGVEEGETSSVTDRGNDGLDEDGDPPWVSTREEKNSQSIGPTQATLLGVGDDVTEVETEGSDEDDEGGEPEGEP